jgi:hypothetical protein
MALYFDYIENNTLRVQSVNFATILQQYLELNFSKTRVYIKILTQSLGMYKRKQDTGKNCNRKSIDIVH